VVLQLAGLVTFFHSGREFKGGEENFCQMSIQRFVSAKLMIHLGKYHHFFLPGLQSTSHIKAEILVAHEVDM